MPLALLQYAGRGLPHVMSTRVLDFMQTTPALCLAKKTKWDQQSKICILAVQITSRNCRVRKKKKKKQPPQEQNMLTCASRLATLSLVVVAYESIAIGHLAREPDPSPSIGELSGLFHPCPCID